MPELVRCEVRNGVAVITVDKRRSTRSALLARERGSFYGDAA